MDNQNITQEIKTENKTEINGIGDSIYAESVKAIKEVYNPGTEQKDKPLYEIVIDNGKPFSETANNDTELKAVLEKYHPKNNPDVPYCDIRIYEDGQDITEYPFIQELIGSINIKEESEPVKTEDPVIEIKEIKEDVPEKTLKDKIDMDKVKLPIGKPIPLEDEVKILKALSNLMDEEPDPELKKDMPERFFVMDVSQIMGFGPKTQEGRRILSRFYKHKIRTPEPNYKIAGPSNYGVNQLIYILKVFNYHKKGKGESEPSITLTVMRDVPICIENEHFICYLAPRIESC